MLGRAYLHQTRNPEFGRTVVTQAVPVSYGPAYASNPGYPPQGPPPGADYYGPSGGYAPPAGPPNAGFAPPPGPPPQGMGYGAGLGPQPRSDPFADPKVDNPFADGTKMPDAEQGYKVEGNSSFK
jgi:hypothetical protein